MGFDAEKFKTMKPMKYVGGAAGKSRVKEFLATPLHYKDWYYSDKVDGEWSRIIHDLDGNVFIQGRGVSRATGEQKDNTELLPHLVEDIKGHVPKGTVLIGELSFFNYIDHVQREVGSILRCKAPKAISRQGDKPLYFYSFDCLAYDGKDLSDEVYTKRVAERDKVDTVYINPIVAHKVDEGVISHLDDILTNGGEGIMIMNSKGKYLPGSRSVTVSLKIKKELGELTLPVVKVLEPKRAYEGREASTWQYMEDGDLVTKYHHNGWKAGVEFEYKDNTVKVTSGITDEDAEWLASDQAQTMIKNGELFASITAMEEFITDGKKSLRHPVILELRHDLKEK